MKFAILKFLFKLSLQNLHHEQLDLLTFKIALRKILKICTNLLFTQFANDLLTLLNKIYDALISEKKNL